MAVSWAHLSSLPLKGHGEQVKTVGGFAQEATACTPEELQKVAGRAGDRELSAKRKEKSGTPEKQQ